MRAADSSEAADALREEALLGRDDVMENTSADEIVARNSADADGGAENGGDGAEAVGGDGASSTAGPPPPYVAEDDAARTPQSPQWRSVRNMLHFSIEVKLCDAFSALIDEARHGGKPLVLNEILFQQLCFACRANRSEAGLVPS